MFGEPIMKNQFRATEPESQNSVPTVPLYLLRGVGI